MRVISGSARGRRLKGPRGRSLITRPSSDLVRGAILSALTSLGADFSRTLDLYAGSGALGIEALSRGAESCAFVAWDPPAAAACCESLRLRAFKSSAPVCGLR